MNNKHIIYNLISEYLFTLFPIIILIIIRCNEGTYCKIFYNSEWSIISLILFGQSIVKFSAGIAHNKKRFHWQLVSLIISLIIIIGLIPSAIILTLILNDGLLFSNGLYCTQALQFILSSGCFFIIGALGQDLLDEEPHHTKLRNN